MTVLGALGIHDLFRAAQTPGARWDLVQGLFAEAGVGLLTVGTGRRDSLDAIAVRTNLPESLMRDYVAEGHTRDDPWIAYSAANSAPESLDMEMDPPEGLSPDRLRLRAFFARQGIARVTLFPVYGGVRPGCIVAYARDAQAAEVLRGEQSRRELHGLAALVAGYWRPEDELFDGTRLRRSGYFLGAPLTLREQEALMWLARGLATAEIAHQMGIAAVTVTKHLTSARLRLGARTREQAVAIALRERLLHL